MIESENAHNLILMILDFSAYGKTRLYGNLYMEAFKYYNYIEYLR